ncbi:MAG: hypothetical protein RJA56_926 [Pseudomonadota bacterium]
MRRVGPINCMGMPMSEGRVLAPSSSAVLNHAGEVAHWIILLLGWIWLGEQGMRLGWSIASGVLAVSVWWTVRLACRGSAMALKCAPRVLGLFGLLTALGVWLPLLMAQPHAAHACLLGLAFVWGIWNALIETRTQVSTFDMGPFAWHPLAAAGLVGTAWRTSAGEPSSYLGVSLLLALCATVLYVRDKSMTEQQTLCRGSTGRTEALLAPSAMGLMMGTLWLGNTWCSALGWTTADMVFAHLVLMAGLPSLVTFLIWCYGRGRLPSTIQSFVSLSLLVLGSLMLLGDSVLFGVLVMVLPSLAWAVHCSRERSHGAISELALAWAVRTKQLLLGPVLLFSVGITTPVQGPWAMQAALALLGALAAWALTMMAWRSQTLKPAFPTPG